MATRREHDGIVRYAHVGTGNYNRVTSQLYTDIGLFTARPAVLDEVTEVSNYLTGYSSKEDYQELLVAPHHLRRASRGWSSGRRSTHAPGARRAALTRVWLPRTVGPQTSRTKTPCGSCQRSTGTTRQ